MLGLKLMDILYLDNYPTLIRKYKDQWRDVYRQERRWAYKNYKEYFRRAWKEHNFKLMIALRRAKRQYDYMQLYNLMIDMDGDLDNQIIIDYVQ